MWRRLSFGLVLGLLVGTAGGVAPLPPGLSALARPMPMPDFRLPDLSGNPVQAADLQGKVVLIRFWATW
ncbi:MAG: hypothetical protein KatS3mg131_1578 [Candidatus Tectimicrobiota bacterium]|nr:MAG: hypothetical protein KatS3mg131_1578 [Candidatus Tectomicrobia bacterium]